MKTISKMEQEGNQIRLGIYEKTSDMPPAQLTEYYRQNTEATMQKYGFKAVASAKKNGTRT